MWKLAVSDHFWKLRCREKVHALVARSTFPSQNVQNTPFSDHFWKLRCRKSARRCGAKHILKSKCTKHLNVGPLLEVEMSKKCFCHSLGSLHSSPPTSKLIPPKKHAGKLKAIFPLLCCCCTTKFVTWHYSTPCSRRTSKNCTPHRCGKSAYASIPLSLMIFH